MKRLTLLPLAVLALSTQPAPAAAGNHWQVLDYRAEHIEGHGIGNRALYCGAETLPACSPADTTGGIGAGWHDDVEWRLTVADPSQPVAVRLAGLMNYDLPDWGWDYVEISIERAGELRFIYRWTGSHTGTVAVDANTTLLPGEFSGPNGDEVRLVWRVVTSEDGWDDEDCITPSHGACQLDDLSVYLDGTLITFDDFEGGQPVNWHPYLEGVTAVDDVPPPGEVTVGAQPNPFNPQVAITFNLPRAVDVSLAVYDLKGRLVRDLLTAMPFPAGAHQCPWDGHDDRGDATPSGVYFYRLAAGAEQLTGTMTLLK